MQAMTGGPATPIEQVTELGEAILEKLIAAGITTVEAVADMTAEELAEVPGIGEKTIEKISVAVRHYFGQYEEGEDRPVPLESVFPDPAIASTDTPEETSSMSKTPEEIIAAERGTVDVPEELSDVSTEDIADVENLESNFDGFSDADNRESQIELDNDAVDELVNDSQEFSDETADIAETTDDHDRG
jgi:N utilization substance protein A